MHSAQNNKHKEKMQTEMTFILLFKNIFFFSFCFFFVVCSKYNAWSTSQKKKINCLNKYRGNCFILLFTMAVMLMMVKS